MTDTDRATERLAEALTNLVVRSGGSVARDLATQGFGHRDDHVRAFAEWVRAMNPAAADILDIYIRDYLASLAAKGEEE